MTDVARSRTFSWTDPRALAKAGAERSGLDFLQSMLRGELPRPPIADLIGYGPGEIAEGRVVFDLQPREYMYNPIGSVHGGIHATLLDTAMACAIHTKLPKGDGYTTLELHINYVKAVQVEVPHIRAIGEVIHFGGRMATAQGRIVDDQGTLYAHGTTTCLLLRAPK